jgi:uncharacterized protein YkwD
MHAATPTAPLIPNRSRLLAAGLAAAFTLASLALAAPVQATTRGDGLRASANEERVERSIPRVQGRWILDSIADARADQMRDARDLEHDMDYVRYRLNKADVCWTSFGEIIAWRSGGSYSYDGTINQWMNSDPHRDILLGSGFNAAGGSWATASDGSHYSVMIFVTLCGSELSTSTGLQPGQEYSPDRPMIFVKGKHTAYKLGSGGQVLSSKTVTFSSRTRAQSTGRTKVDGKAYLKVTSGALSGYWVRETPRSYVRGMTAKTTYASPRAIAVAEGTYTGYTFDSLGRVTGKRTGTLAWNSGADASARAIINGKPFFLVKNGMWAGYWLRDTRQVNPIS